MDSYRSRHVNPFALLKTVTPFVSSPEVELLTYLLDVVVGKCAAILQLLARENQSLLVRWDAFLVLDLGLDIVDCVARFDFEGDGLTRQGLDKAGEFISG